MALLVVQFLVGMTLDMFIELPDSHPGMTGGFLQRGWDGYAWAATSGDVALQIHLVIATVLVLGSIATLGFAIAGRHRAWIITSSVGLVGVWLSFLNGIVFIDTNDDKHSFAMAVAFMIAFIAYGAGLYHGKIKK